MSSLTHSSDIFQYHREMLKRHGEKSSNALGWRDFESQQVRFKALAGIADLANCELMDAGCGYADLLPYLTDLYGPIKYIGIEQIPELLNVAIKRYGDWPNADFISGNFTTLNLPEVDYVFASGSLNYRSTDPEFIYKTISKLLNACRKGLAFNLLKATIPGGVLMAYDPNQIVAYCRAIAKEIKYIDNYADEDFTLYLYK